MRLFSVEYGCVVGYFFFKQKTAYELRISDLSSDVCSSDLLLGEQPFARVGFGGGEFRAGLGQPDIAALDLGEAQHLQGLGHREQVVDLHMQEIGRASCRERVCKYV